MGAARQTLTVAVSGATLPRRPISGCRQQPLRRASLPRRSSRTGPTVRFGNQSVKKWVFPPPMSNDREHLSSDHGGGVVVRQGVKKIRRVPKAPPPEAKI